MSVTTVSSSSTSISVPYSCRCAFCGAEFRSEDKISAEGHAFQGGYASESQKTLMGLSSNIKAWSSLPRELDYAEARLEHYRSTVAGGKLAAYLKTGRPRKQDWFRVEKGSGLEAYLKSTVGKTQGQFEKDKARMKAFPYVWKSFDKDEYVKCPQCGKAQPWCYDAFCAGPYAATIVSFIVLGALLFFFPVFGKNMVNLPGLANLAERLTQSSGAVKLAYYVGVFAVPILLCKLLMPLLRKIALRKVAAMPWRAEDLPRYDADFLARLRKELAGPAGNAGAKKSKPAPKPAASDPVETLLVYMDIDKLDSGVYGMAAGQAVAKAVPARLLEGMRLSSGDSNATLRGSANEYVIGITGRASALREAESRLRADEGLKALLSASGIRRGSGEPLVLDGTVQGGELVNPPGHSTSFCGAGFKDAWKKQAEAAE